MDVLSFALQHNHLANVLRPSAKFVAALLLSSLYRHYAELASLDVRFLSPKAMKLLLKCIPKLLSLIISLPSLLMAAKWPAPILMQLTLSFSYWASLRPNLCSKLPLSSNLDEQMAHWQDDGILLTKPMSLIHHKCARRLIKSHQTNGQALVPLLRHRMELDWRFRKQAYLTKPERHDGIWYMINFLIGSAYIFTLKSTR